MRRTARCQVMRGAQKRHAASASARRLLDRGHQWRVSQALAAPVAQLRWGATRAVAPKSILLPATHSRERQRALVIQTPNALTTHLTACAILGLTTTVGVRTPSPRRTR